MSSPFARRRPRRRGPIGALVLAAGMGGLLGLAAPLAFPLAGHSQAAPTSEANVAGNKGAQVYCFMRGNGNIHEVSWAAAYALIKRQSASLFKTSPEHAAVMVTEAVVQNPATYPDCGRYLGDLYTRRRTVVLSSGTYPPGTGAGVAAPAGAMPAAGQGTGSQGRW
jgi:hypothetical protein